ncbi:MAG TPA: VOC family protein [Caldisericia bacterium]|nr:VOC family protein [Caldisericia bacterium]HPF49462.1 VOC family protein [Caldisericia bacterium]HPI84680.1 VOC family protein [Caldisericia bacterium]HPQ93631.1 VOC family protein [Caldisericia bacterium]HRV75602.1 VOC family protein [Caldisericia bacterium]
MSDFDKICKEYGKARVDSLVKIKETKNWEDHWPENKNEYPFNLGPCWKQCVEYYVDDFEAEVGFFVDMMGLFTNAFDDNYAMLMSPEKEFYFSFWKADKDKKATPPGAIKLCFLDSKIKNLKETLEGRGVPFTNNIEPLSEGSPMYRGECVSPNGTIVEIWGMEEEEGE